MLHACAHRCLDTPFNSLLCSAPGVGPGVGDDFVLTRVRAWVICVPGHTPRAAARMWRVARGVLAVTRTSPACACVCGIRAHVHRHVWRVKVVLGAGSARACVHTLYKCALGRACSHTTLGAYACFCLLCAFSLPSMAGGDGTRHTSWHQRTPPDTAWRTACGT